MKNNPDELYDERRVDDITFKIAEELTNKIQEYVVKMYEGLDAFGESELNELEAIIDNEFEDFLQEIRELKS